MLPVLMNIVNMTEKKIFYHLREDEYYNTELKALKSVDFNIKYSIGRYENGPYDIE